MVDISRRDVLRLTGSGVALGGVAPAAARGPPSDRDPHNRYIVGITPGNEDLPKQAAADVHRELNFGDIGAAVSGHFPEPALNGLRNNPNVRYIEQNGRVEAVGHATDGGTGDPDAEQVRPWGIDRIGANDAQHDGTTGQGTDVAIIDTGIDPTHHDLDGNLGQGWATAPCDDSCLGWWCPANGIDHCYEPWDDDNDHGSHVAGTVAALDDGLGVLGVAPEVTLHAVKVLGCCGRGSFDDVAAGLTWVADQGFDVANMSLGGGESQVMADAAAYAWSQGVVLVASAGNAGPCTDCVSYPAGYDEVIAVGAIDENDDLASFSSQGPAVELAAPGVGILSSIPRDEFGRLNGTSMAAPHVAGAAAALMAAGHSHTEARQRLADSAEDLGLPSSQQGAGLVDVPAALSGSLSVRTEGTAGIGPDTATLRGELTDAEGTAAVFFEWRETEATTWNATDPTDRSAAGTFEHDITGLAYDTTYEFRAVATGDGVTVRGDPLEFRTDPPAELLVESGEVTSVGQTTLTLAGELVGLGEHAEAVVGFEWRRTGLDQWHATAGTTVSQRGEYSETVDGLESATEYEWRALAEADGSTDRGQAATVTTAFDDSLVVETATPTDVGETSATLAGELTDLGDHSQAELGFDWRRADETDWQHTDAVTASATGALETTLDGLVDGTEYEYRAVGQSGEQTDRGAVESFTTAVDFDLAVKTEPAADVTDTSANLVGSLTTLSGYEQASVGFEWRRQGEDAWEEVTVGEVGTTGSFDDGLDGLESETTYEYRAVADVDGDTDTGAIRSFETEITRELAVTTGDTTEVDVQSATLDGELTTLVGYEGASVAIEWREAGTDTWTRTEWIDRTQTGSFSMDVDGLNGDTDYEYRAVAESGETTETGTVATFRTAVPLAVSVETEPAVVGESDATLVGTLTELQGTDAATLWFEWREAGATAWTATGTTSQTTTGEFSVGIEGLTSGTEYEYRAIAEAEDETSTGDTRTFVTESALVLDVETRAAQDVGWYSATLTGALVELSGTSEVHAAFELRAVGDSDWNQTTTQSLTSPTEFTVDLSGLSLGTEYEFRAIASSGSLVDRGSVETFTPSWSFW